MVRFRITGGELKPEIEMSSSGTILELKERIYELCNVEVARQTLFFYATELENDRTIESYEFLQPFETLGLVVTPLSGDPKFDILVKSSTAEDCVRVRETQKVADLRRKIERRWGILAQKITLLSHSIEMNDDHLLSAYYVNRGSIVEVKVSIESR
ncbi:hypothetical protein ACB098_09G030800 [Castanea mollissima]